MKNSYEIIKGCYNFHEYFEVGKISNETQHMLLNKDIVVVPTKYADEEYYFSQETTNFIKFFRAVNPKYSIDILADGDITVRALHSFDIWLPIFYVASNVLFPIITSLISCYIWEKIRGREHEEVNVFVSILVKRGDEQIEIRYDGDAKNFKEVIEKIDINKL